MRYLALVGALLGCGRIGFSARAGDDAMSDAPIDAMTGEFTRVFAYSDSTCSVHGGRLLCWGDNTAGQLGDGTMMDRAAPRPAQLPEAGVLGAVSLGETHACAVIDTMLYCWGNGFAPAPLALALPGPATDVAAGKDFTCVLIGQTVHCAGTNGAGQLGDGTMMSRAMQMPIMTAETFSAIDAGDDHACGATTTARAMCWGHNDSGTLGTGSNMPNNSPTPVLVLPSVTTLPRIAGWHACTVQANRAICWGRNAEGALGDGTMTSTPTPQLVPGLDPVDVIATGGGPTDLDATCAISSGDVYCFGMGLNGRLGNGSADLSLVPIRVSGLPGKARDVALGYGHTCAVLEDGNIWCWGRGDRGQLGDGKMTSSFTPVRVEVPLPN